MRCEICFLATAAFWARVSGYDHYRCSACSHLFVFPKPTQSALQEFYEDGEFYDQAEAEELRLANESRARLRWLATLAGHENLDRGLLDVGCASGVFSREATRKGWRVTCVELSQVLAERARSKGLEVIHGRLEDLPESDRYPVLTAWEVLEHTVDPEHFLRQMAQRVVPGGIVALSTPLSDGLPAKLLSTRYPMICPPAHISIFSRTSLCILARRLGLQLIRFRSFSGISSRNVHTNMARLLPPALAKPLAIGLSPIAVLLARSIDFAGLGTEMEVAFRTPRQAITS